VTPQQALAADSVRRVLTAVLSDPEFEERMPSHVTTLFGRAWEWISSLVSKALGWLFRDTDFTAPSWHVAGWIFVLMGAAVGVWLLVRLTRIGLQALRRDGGRRDASGGSRAARERTAADWEALAREASRGQRWREASLALYHAVVLRLAEAGRLKPSASKTPGDYRKELAGGAASGDLHVVVADFLHSFERVAFARSLPIAADYHRLRDMAELLGAHG